MKTSNEDLLIWDDDGPSPFAKNTIMWQSYSDNQAASISSIPKLVEENSLEFRALYLAWIYELGEKKCDGKRIVEYLQLRPNLSFWWLTLLTEKCNFAKSPQIEDIIKLFALEKWLKGRKFDHIRVVSSNQHLAAIIKKWCLENGVKFEFIRSNTKSLHFKSWRRVVFDMLPLSLQAILWLLRKIWVSWPLRGAGVDLWRASSADITFISYLFNLDPQVALEGRFKSRYWAHLSEQLDYKKISTRWLHLWVKNGDVSTAREARILIDQFNASDSSSQVHVTLESFIGYKVIFYAVRDWIKIRRFGAFLEGLLGRNCRRAGFDPWPLVREDWRKSIYGIDAISNHLILNSFEAAFNGIIHQRIGAYLQENIGWEFGVIASWRGEGYGRLVGVPHSTVRFWDLRYHFDKRNYDEIGKHSLPLPDCVAVNGPIAKNILCESGWPSNMLVEVEALRYLHLINSDIQRHEGSKKCKYRLLVIGDYLFSNTYLQMKILESSCIKGGLSNVEIVLKPHPACPISIRDYPGIDFSISTDSLSELLFSCDIAYASSCTSGAVDAYLSGVPVISVLDEKTLNLSPLRGLPNTIFISNYQDFDCVIDNFLLNKNREKEEKVPYFNLNSSLSNWKQVIQYD
jgi:surface carbohydrate biosynthesis protein (TIGR04326 family)